MDVQKKLSRLAAIDGFMGTALFSAEGRLLAKCEPSDIDLKLIASLANSVLVNAQKAALDMGFGRSQFTYIHTEKALILLRCLNEGRSPLQADPGKCHIHLVLLVDNPDSLGIARLEINKVIESLAEDFRMPEAAAAAPVPTHTAVRSEQQKETADESPATEKKLQDVAASLSNETIDEMFDGLLV